MNKKLIFFIAFLFIFSLSACQNQDQELISNKEVVITFNANNSQTVETRVFSNQKLNFLPDDPTKEGYLFDGWYTDQDLTLPFDPKLLTYNSEDLTLYAKWIQSKRTIYFETDSNNIVQPLQIEINKPIALPSGLQKNGYHFYGWYLDEELTIPLEIDLMPDNDLTLYARWTDNIFYYDIINESDIVITGLIPETLEGLLEIPETIDEYQVVSLSYDALKGYSNITVLMLPDSLTDLPLGVLRDQVNLFSLRTPFLGVSRYDNTSDFQSINQYLLGTMFALEGNQAKIFDDIVETYQRYVPFSLGFLDVTDSEIIPSHSISYTKIQRVTFSEGTKTIKELVFHDSNVMTSISIPESVETIEPGAFVNMENLYYFFVSPTNNYFSTNELSNMLLNKDQTELYAYGSGVNNYFAEIPNTVTYIHTYAFTGSSIFKIVIPESVVTIDSFAFFDCSHLTTLIFEENSQLTTIGAYAFSNANLISLTIPNHVTMIGNNAFDRNFSLETLLFEAESSVSIIGYQAFAKTYSLTSVILPISVEYLHSGIFFGARDLTVYAEALEKPVGWVDNWSTSIDEEHIIWGYVED